MTRIDMSPVSITQAAFVEHLQEHVKNFRRGLFDFIQQHNTVRAAAQAIGQLSATLGIFVAGGRANQTGNASSLSVHLPLGGAQDATELQWQRTTALFDALGAQYPAYAARLAQRNRTEFYRLLQKHALTPGSFKSDAPTLPNGAGSDTVADE